jgi:hypothetical protein
MTGAGHYTTLTLFFWNRGGEEGVDQACVNVSTMYLKGRYKRCETRGSGGWYEWLRLLTGTRLLHEAGGIDLVGFGI